VNSPEDGPAGPKHVEIHRYMNKIETVTSVGFSFLIQHLLSSLSVSDRPVHMLRELFLKSGAQVEKEFFLNLYTGRSLTVQSDYTRCCINTLNSELNLICHLLALLGAHHILHVSGLRVNTI